MQKKMEHKEKTEKVQCKNCKYRGQYLLMHLSKKKDCKDKYKNEEIIITKGSILVVDDGSPDGTLDIILKLREKYSNLNFINREKKLGLGTAYCMGFIWAIDHGFDKVVQIDADLSHDPNEIVPMFNLLDQYDLVIGSRYKGGLRVWDGFELKAIERESSLIQSLIKSTKSSKKTNRILGRSAASA